MKAVGVLLAICGLRLATVAVDVWAADLPGEELLTNRGFESVGPLGPVIYAYQGWTVRNGLVPGGWAGLPCGPEAAVEMVQDEGAHSGKAFMRISSGSQSPEVFSEPFYQTAPGMCFEMSVWARGKGRGSLFAYEYGGTMAGRYVRTFDLTTEWTQHGGLYFPDEHSQQIRFVLRTFPGSTADYDDLGMVKLSDSAVTPEMAGELLDNGGLEHETPVREEWVRKLSLAAGTPQPDFFELDGEQATITMVHGRDGAHSGEVCARLARTAEGGWLRLYTTRGQKALPGFGFVLKAWLRGRGSAWLGLYDAAAAGGPAGRTHEVDDQWREYSVTLIPAPSAKSVRFAVGTSGPELWVDDVSLTYARTAGADRSGSGRDPDMEQD